MAFQLRDVVEESRERKWREAGVPNEDIQSSRVTGMDARDVGVFRRFSAQRALIILVRCPTLAGRSLHGVLPPKPLSFKAAPGTSAKSSSASGTVEDARGRIYVSDYDLMSVWRLESRRWTKLFIAADGGKKTGSYPPDAQRLLQEMNRELVSKIQHGCADDWKSRENPGAKPEAMYCSFALGRIECLRGLESCRRYYTDHGLSPFPYDKHGGYLL